MLKRLKPIAKFASEAAERTFWEKTDLTAYIDRSKAVRPDFPNLKKPEPDQCGRRPGAR
jgi:hypothetical protein